MVTHFRFYRTAAVWTCHWAAPSTCQTKFTGNSRTLRANCSIIYPPLFLTPFLHSHRVISFGRNIFPILRTELRIPELPRSLWHIPMQLARHKQDSLLSNSARNPYFISSRHSRNKNSRDISFGIRVVTRMRTAWPENPSRSNRLISSPKRSSRLWDPSSLPFNG